MFNPTKRKDPGYTGSNQPSKRARSMPPALVALEVHWSPEDQLGDAASFHVYTEATVSGTIYSEVTIVQYVRDGMSIKGGTPAQLNSGFQRNIFGKDKRESIAIETGKAVYDDKPGFGKDANLTAHVNIKYIFGAYWEIYVGEDLLATTKPLYGMIKGKHPRTYRPAGQVVARWDAKKKKWRSYRPLKKSMPRWNSYPRPRVNNS
jgi:hypothetical protein